MRQLNRSAWVGTVLAALVLASTAQVIAQTTPEPSRTTTGTMNTNTDASIGVTGRVTSIDSTGRTITVDTPSGPVIYRTNTSSRYMSGGRTIEFSGVRTNDRVTIYTTGTGDAVMLSRLEVMPGTDTTGTSGAPYNTNSANRDAVAGNRNYDDNTGSTTTTASNYDNRNLPRTASLIPLIGLAGVVLLGVAFAIRVGTRWMH